MLTLNRTKKFLHLFPGPYAYCPGSEGVDSTFDVYCTTTEQFLMASYYWDEQEQAELEARTVAIALTHCLMDKPSANPEFLEQCSELGLLDFREEYPGRYRAVRSHCDYHGPGYEILCDGDESAAFIRSGTHTRLIAQHVAACLNRMFAALDNIESSNRLAERISQ
ncbi:MAG: hypothetical protein KDB27_21135 [Planctomycetales bacterium]|nr:hypothetical protein [Planctomycetales bacterium]